MESESDMKIQTSGQLTQIEMLWTEISKAFLEGRDLV